MDILWGEKTVVKGILEMLQHSSLSLKFPGPNGIVKAWVKAPGKAFTYVKILYLCKEFYLIASVQDFPELFVKMTLSPFLFEI